MRLVRELLAADVEPALAQASPAARAARYVEVVTTGLALRAATVLVLDPASGKLTVAASTLPNAATATLTDANGRGAALARRAIDERRALLARKSADDPLVRSLQAADPSIETVAILPLADRSPVGVVVLAGDETTLAIDVVRTLNPAVRLLALLVSPQRDGVCPPGTADDGAELARAELDASKMLVRTLEARVAELEALLAAAPGAARQPDIAVDVSGPAVVEPRPAPRTVVTPAMIAEAAAESARMAAALAAEAADPTPPTIVVADTALDWSRWAVADHEVVTTGLSADAVGRTVEARPQRIVLNVAAPGAFAHGVALRAHGVTAPIFGVVAHPGAERVVGLDVVETVGHPLDADALIAAVSRAAPRGARVFAAGRDADPLLKMRQMLAKQGLSVSLARDTKQIDELLAMVRPQVVVIDLALPLRQGYELVMRMAATTPIPAMVLIAPEIDPGPLLVDKLRDRIAAGVGVGAKQWLVALAQQKLPSKTVPRPKGSATSPAR